MRPVNIHREPEKRELERDLPASSSWSQPLMPWFLTALRQLNDLSPDKSSFVSHQVCIGILSFAAQRMLSNAVLVMGGEQCFCEELVRRVEGGSDNFIKW